MLQTLSNPGKPAGGPQSAQPPAPASASQCPVTSENAESGDSTEPSESPQSSQPAGIALAALLIAVAAVVALYSTVPNLSAQPIESVIGSLSTPMILLVAGIGLWRRRGWGWWCACAILYFIGLQALLISALQVAGLGDGRFGIAPIVLAGCAVVIIYLSRPDVIGRMRFSPRTGQSARSAAGPAVAGFTLGFFAILAQMLGVL